MMKWERIKAGLYHAENDSVVKREKGRWLIYRGKFDLLTGRKVGVFPPTAHRTLKEAKAHG